MRKAICVFKKLSVISFLALIIPNEKFSVPMVVWLFAALTGFAGFAITFFSIIISMALFYFFITGFNFIDKRYDTWISLICILILGLAASMSMVNVFKYHIFLAYLTHFICLLILLITLILITKKM
jgi:hypothetical protein